MANVEDMGKAWDAIFSEQPESHVKKHHEQIGAIQLAIVNASGEIEVTAQQAALVTESSTASLRNDAITALGVTASALRGMEEELSRVHVLLNAATQYAQAYRDQLGIQ